MISRLSTALVFSLATLVVLNACKAQRAGDAQVRELGDAGSTDGKDLGVRLSELASAMEGDIALIALGGASLPDPDAASGFALADETVLTPDELDALRARVAASNASLRRAQEAVDRRDQVRAATIARLSKRLTEATAALSAINPEDTDRYRQGLADMRRVMDELAAATGDPAVAAVGSGAAAAVAAGAGSGTVARSGATGPAAPGATAPAPAAAPAPAVDPRAFAKIQGLWLNGCQALNNTSMVNFMDILADGRIVYYTADFQGRACTGTPFAVRRTVGKVSMLRVAAGGVYTLDDTDRALVIFPNSPAMVSYLSANGLCGGSGFSLGQPTRLTIAGCQYAGDASSSTFSLSESAGQRVWTSQKSANPYTRLGDSNGLDIALFPKAYRAK